MLKVIYFRNGLNGSTINVAAIDIMNHSENPFHVDVLVEG